MTSFSSEVKSEGLKEDWKTVRTDEGFNVDASCSFHSDFKQDDEHCKDHWPRVDPSLEQCDNVSETERSGLFLESGKSEFDTQHLETASPDVSYGVSSVSDSADDGIGPLEGDVYVVKSEAESNEPFDQEEKWDVMSVDSDATVGYRLSGRMEMDSQEDCVEGEETHDFESSGTEQQEVSSRAAATSAINSTVTRSGFLGCDRCQAVFRTKKKLRTHKCSLTTYSCEVCRATFPEKWRLRRHSLVHSRTYKCSICFAIFSDRTALREHASSHTAPEAIDKEDQDSFETITPNRGTKRNFCTQPDVETRSFEMDKGTRSEAKEAKRLFKCAECGAAYTNRGNLTIHQKRHTDVGPHRCSRCGMCFKRLSGLINHELRKHNDSKLAKLRQQEESFTCGHCNASFMKLTSLKNHLSHHAPYNNDERDKKRGEDGLYPCPWCDKNFEEFRHLKRHEGMHEGVCAFVCNECGAPFNRKASLTRHVCRPPITSSPTEPKGDKPSQPKSTSQIKPYECQECGARRATKVSLLAHQRTHTGERPFSCPLCPATFTDRSTRNRHKRIHSGERPYGCSQCPARFYNRQHLTRHEQAHNNERNEVCPDCHKRFITKGQLRVHSRIHSGDRPFVCSICSASFVESGRLLRHYDTHEGNHVCDTCGARFKLKSRLDLHVVNHL